MLTNLSPEADSSIVEAEDARADNQKVKSLHQWGVAAIFLIF